MLTIVLWYFPVMLGLLLFVRMRSSFYSLFIAMSALACAVIFFPWCKHRETLSGFCGRMTCEGKYGALRQLFIAVATAIDSLFPGERNHCWLTWQEETAARKVIYGETESI